MKPTCFDHPDQRHRMESQGIPDGWVIWNDEPERLILAFKPDVFNSSDFPAPCLPTIQVSQSDPDQRRSRSVASGDGSWHVVCHLEPEIRLRE
ncbi:MAG: DUF5820 family protein, partial [Halobacteriaceae archaeon]